MSPRPELLRDWIGKDLSEFQLQAAVAPLEPGLIVAGAGTGKTTVMAARVTWLVATGLVRPDEVLGLTFTTKAAAELASRVRQAVQAARAHRPATPDEAGDPQISTYHSFANSLVLEHGPLVGAEPNSRVLSEAALRQLAHRVVCRTSHAFDSEVTGIDQLASDVVALDSALAENDVDPHDLRDSDRRLIEELLENKQQAIGDQMVATANRRRDLAALVVELRAEKQRIVAIDFADQLRWAATLARSYPMVGQQLRQRYRVVLLDEYQDTSVSQRVLMQSLFGGGHAVTAVGDPFQAIYAFRGASVRNIEDFPQHFARSDGSPAPKYQLSENRRSRQDILDVANDVADVLRVGTDVAPLVSARPEGGFPTADIICSFHDTQDEECSWVADQVERVLHAGHGAADVTVLLRAMTRAGLYRDALAARGIPVEVVGVEGLLALPEVAEVVSVLQLLHDPTANPACARLLSGPRWRIGPRDLRLVGRRAAEIAGVERPQRGQGVRESVDAAVAGSDPADLVSLLDALDDLGPIAISDDARQRVTQFAAELRMLRRHVGEPLGDLVQRVLDTTGFEAELMAAPLGRSEQQLAALHAFTALAAEFRDLDGRATLGSFLRFLADAKRLDASPEAIVPTGVDAVRIMSAHKSKGLEFPVVVLPELVEGTFPSDRGMNVWPTSAKALPFNVRHEPAPADLPNFPEGPIPRASEHDAFRAAVREVTVLDETRLAYVAITRAETTLIACGSRWSVSGAKTEQQPSRYLLAVRERCEAGQGTVDAWSEVTDHEGNPLAERESVTWPTPIDAESLVVRREAATAVLARIGSVTSLDHCAVPDSVADAANAQVASWDADLAALLAEAERDAEVRVVPMPESLSTTDVQRLLADEESFVASLVRPMPRQPSRAARRGTRFHAWVESLWGQQPLLLADDLPGAADADIGTDAELEAIQQTFLTMPYASWQPVALEEPFAVVLAGRVVPGRIDAVFRHDSPEPGHTRWEVVDWKTSRQPDADPLQLAIYRLAWAERLGVPLELVDASFVYVRLGEVRHFGDAPGAQALPDRAELERLLTGS